MRLAINEEDKLAKVNISFGAKTLDIHANSSVQNISYLLFRTQSVSKCSKRAVELKL